MNIPVFMTSGKTGGRIGSLRHTLEGDALLMAVIALVQD